jgi:putative membrane protein
MHVASWWFLGMHAFWWLFWIVLLVWAYRYAVSRVKQQGRRETPLEVLQRRYAAGELSTQEYEERKARLGSSTEEHGDA